VGSVMFILARGLMPCAHPPCRCPETPVRGGAARYCSEACASGSGDGQGCACGHPSCRAPVREPGEKKTGLRTGKPDERSGGRR
jgi:hypothetical protein